MHMQPQSRALTGQMASVRVGGGGWGGRLCFAFNEKTRIFAPSLSHLRLTSRGGRADLANRD